MTRYLETVPHRTQNEALIKEGISLVIFVNYILFFSVLLFFQELNLQNVQGVVKEKMFQYNIL